MYWLSQAAVASVAAAAVLEAGRKRYDLFGMLMIAVTAALGGGSLRDMLLDRPVFWIQDQTFLIMAMAAALLTFFIVRYRDLPMRFFLISDALGLALFTVVGTRVAWNLDTPWFVAAFMGVVTGVMGGILRDMMCNEEPLIFKGPLYATAAWSGAFLYVLLRSLEAPGLVPAIAAGALVLLMRLAAIRYSLGLPTFRDRSSS